MGSVHVATDTHALAQFVKECVDAHSDPSESGIRSALGG